MTDKGPIFITSYGQTGGITAHTVNVGHPRRRLTKQMTQELKNAIPLDASVIVKTLMGDGEAISFAHEIFQWLEQTGYTKASFRHCVFSGPVSGQGIQKTAHGYDIIVGCRE